MIASALFCVFLMKFAAAVPAGVYVGKDGTVGASFGEYSASAGLGGIANGGGAAGGLHAEAKGPNGYQAAAGLGGSASPHGPQGQLYAAANRGGIVPVQGTGGISSSSSQSSSSSFSSSSGAQNGAGYQGGPFDGVFNIPIAALGAVNQYLNNRNRGVVVSPSSSSSSAFSSASSSASSSSSSASSGANANGNVNAANQVYVVPNRSHHHHHQGTKYDDIFNIPISVLNSVNRFLNG